jgi:hypothetical protein
MFLSRMNLKNSNGRDSAANSDYLNKVLCSVGTEGRDLPKERPTFNATVNGVFVQKKPNSGRDSGRTFKDLRENWGPGGPTTSVNTVGYRTDI